MDLSLASSPPPYASDSRPGPAPAVARPVSSSAAPSFGDALDRLTLASILDELDYGVMLVAESGFVQLANHMGLRECAPGGVLALVQGHVQARLDSDRPAFHRALHDGARGRRTLINLGAAAHSVALAMIPLPTREDDPPRVLLVTGKRDLGESLSVDFFARQHQLTSTETAVLRGLCDGRSPTEIGRDHHVTLNTIRTQIATIRTKTGSRSITDLVRKVTALPPITTSLCRSTWARLSASA